METSNAEQNKTANESSEANLFNADVMKLASSNPAEMTDFVDKMLSQLVRAPFV